MARIAVRPETKTLFLDFMVRGVRCREQTLLTDTPANRKRLSVVLDKIKAEITLGSYDHAAYFPESRNAVRISGKVQTPANPPLVATMPAAVEQGDRESREAVTSPLFSEFAETWYTENMVRWRRTTQGLMRSNLDRHLIPKFGPLTIASITRPLILEFRAELAKLNGKIKGETISPKTINDIVGMLKSILDEAAERYRFVSAYQRIKRLKVPRKDIKPFTLEETLKLIAEVRADFRDYFVVRFFTGMRTGEANGLKWCHVDFDRRQILVRESFTHGEQDNTKTDGSLRDIEMSQAVYDALKAMHACTSARGEYVFCNRAGEPLDNKNFCARIWYPLLKRLGLARRRPYQMRHTCATLWLGAGENPEWISKQLGHATTEMLFRVYSRFVPNLTRRDGSAFNRLLNGAMNSPAGEGATTTATEATHEAA